MLYLLVGIFGGFAEGYLEPRMYVAGNAAATAGNVVANSGLVRMGVVADLLDGTSFIILALVLYVLLEHVQKSVARAMLVPLLIIDLVFSKAQCSFPIAQSQTQTQEHFLETALVFVVIAVAITSLNALFEAPLPHFMLQRVSRRAGISKWFGRLRYLAVQRSIFIVHLYPGA